MSETDEALQGEFAQRAARTARSHLDAAKCLLAGEFWPQAYALAATGFEEAGKAWIATLEMLSPPDLRETLPEDLGRGHVTKLSAAYSMLAMLQFAAGVPDHSITAEEVLVEVGDLARRAHAGSQRGLYTDVRKGVVRSPEEVTEQEAREIVAEVENVLDGGGVLIDLATALWARDAVPEDVRSFLTRAASASKAGPEEIAVFVQRELGAMDRAAEVLRDSPEVLQLIRDDPDWVSNTLRLASELHAPGGYLSGSTQLGIPPKPGLDSAEAPDP